MIVVVLLASGRSLSSTRLGRRITQLRATVPGADLEVHLVSWGGTAPRSDLASSIVVRPRPTTLPRPTSSEGRVTAGAWVQYGARRLVRAAGWRARRIKPLRKAELALRGSLSRQFAARAVRNAEVLDLVRRSDVVISLDAGSLRTAWRLARRVRGPAVMNGLAAGQQAMVASAARQAQAARPGMSSTGTMPGDLIQPWAGLPVDSSDSSATARAKAR